jgi:hypothetical protein
MSKNVKMNGYIATVESGPARTPEAHRIDAAYYKTDGGFTTFKDIAHQDVFTVRNDLLQKVSRIEGQMTILMDLQNLLSEAQEKGSVRGSVTALRFVDPDGNAHWDTCDVRISRADSGALPATCDPETR